MTVWYFDAEERAEAKKKFRNLTGMTLRKCSPEISNCMDFFFLSSPKAETDWE